MSMVKEACPSCAAPLDIPDNVARIKCPYCMTSIAVQRQGSEIALAIASTLATSIEKSGTQTQDAIKEGSYVTQTELRRLQVAQDLSMVQMRLSNVQGEIRSIERLPLTPITRKQLAELRANETDLLRQIKTLTDVLNPQTIKSTPETPPSRVKSSNASNNKLTWILFSTTGRMGRRGYWVGLVIVAILFFLIGVTSPSSTNSATGEPTSSLSFFAFIFMLLFLWINYAIAAKRYHDRGKSAWWAFIAFIPVIGIFWQAIELGFFPGDPGPNKYS